MEKEKITISHTAVINDVWLRKKTTTERSKIVWKPKFIAVNVAIVLGAIFTAWWIATLSIISPYEEILVGTFCTACFIFLVVLRYWRIQKIHKSSRQMRHAYRQFLQSYIEVLIKDHDNMDDTIQKSRLWRQREEILALAKSMRITLDPERRKVIPVENSHAVQFPVAEPTIFRGPLPTSTEKSAQMNGTS